MAKRSNPMEYFEANYTPPIPNTTYSYRVTAYDPAYAASVQPENNNTLILFGVLAICFLGLLAYLGSKK